MRVRDRKKCHNQLSSLISFVKLLKASAIGSRIYISCGKICER